MDKHSIREAKLSDMENLTDLLCSLTDEFLRARSDRVKIKKFLNTVVGSKQHKVLVAATGKDLTGVMVTITDSYDIAEKMYGQIRFLYADEAADLQEMVAETMKWVKTRRAVQVVCYSSLVKTNADDVLLDNDFEETGSMLVWRRYGNIQ
jgi:hypothetical protein